MITKNIIATNICNLIMKQKQLFIKNIVTHLNLNSFHNNTIMGKKQLNYNNRYYFTIFAKRQQSVTPLQNVFSKISSLTANDINNQKLQVLHQLIHSSALSYQQISSTTKFLMSILYKNNYPTQQLLNNPIIKKIQEKQPFLQLQTTIYIINKDLTSNKPNYDLINNLYLHAFQKIIPNITDLSQKLKCEVLLFKNFGKYMLTNGQKAKGLQSLQKSIVKHKQLVIQQFMKIQYLNKKFDSQDKIKKKNSFQKQHQKLQINALKQNIRRLIQSMFQTIHYFYLSKQQIIASSTSPKEKENILIQICSIISNSMKIKTIIPGIHLYSKYYHRLKQIHLQLQFTHALMNKNEQKAQQILNLMKQFIKSCIKDISQSINQIELHREIALSAFSIQFHLSRRQKNVTNDQIKQSLSQLLINILQAGKMQQNKLQKDLITKLLKDFLKKIIHS